MTMWISFPESASATSASAIRALMDGRPSTPTASRTASARAGSGGEDRKRLVRTLILDKGTAEHPQFVQRVASRSPQQTFLRLKISKQSLSGAHRADTPKNLRGTCKKDPADAVPAG